MFKRILLFLGLNLLVITMVTLVLNILGVQPYLNAYGLDYQSLMIFCLVWGMVGAVVSLCLSRVMAKWMLGVNVIDPSTQDPQLKELLYTVQTLSRKAEIPMPQVGVYRSNEVNAFATGPTKKRSLVAVSSGLLNRMNQQELEGVLGHELAHIANGDMVTMTLLQGVINAFVMFLARILASLLSGLGKNKNNSQNGSYASFVLFTYLFEAIFMTLGFMVIAAYSRYREFKADRGGSRITGKASMISALESLKSLKHYEDTKQNEAIAAFKIAGSKKKGIRSLFSTHPPIEERIERLQRQ
ncbi:MAG TPA: protease HtpX [Chlamydiales bacterium]|nr:protease HtpX [Chlamydiales bacterium]